MCACSVCTLQSLGDFGISRKYPEITSGKDVCILCLEVSVKTLLDLKPWKITSNERMIILIEKKPNNNTKNNNLVFDGCNV